MRERPGRKTAIIESTWSEGSETQAEFIGTERFERLERLGAGGMGVVYLARDRQREQRVALKLLSRVNPAAIMRFKREFRALAYVAHRNLVSLYELSCTDDHWFFTMEYIRGVDLATRCAGASAPPLVSPVSPASGTLAVGALDSTVSDPRPGASGTSRPIAPGASRAVADGEGAMERLRGALIQLAEAVDALHTAGHLHCDIKPNNILVSDDRVVLLDFGLITAIYAERGGDDEIVGTPAYMAPEQVRGARLTPATDWFSFGVVLHVLLTGRLPRDDDWFANYVASGDYPAVESPCALRPDTPAELAALCVGLLDPEPSVRPAAGDVLEALGGDRASVRRRRRTSATALIGRAAQLHELRGALDDTRQPYSQTVYVVGAPGMGKTALVQHFLASVRRDPRAVVLAGRCYQRESAPYKLLDSLIDALTGYLRGRSDAELDALRPPDAALLARVFPVLRREHRCFGLGPAPADDAVISHELRRRASAALVWIMTRIARDRRLVQFIDDVQWGDLDSVPLLDALMRQADAPILLVLAYRGAAGANDRPNNRVIRSLRRSDVGANSPPRRIAVGPLAVAQAEALCARLLRDAGGDEAWAPRLAGETAGDPLFLRALVGHALSDPAWTSHEISLDVVLAERVARLDAGARRLLEIVAVAAQQVPYELARRAADLDGDDCARAIARLRAEHLVNLHETAAAAWLETYHDRIREYVAGALSPTVRAAYNRGLAEAAASLDEGDPEVLAGYFGAAGDREAAARYALLASRNAARALSFARAAELLERALEWGAHSPATRRRLLVELGGLHKAVGDGEAAARAYLAAAAVSEPHDAFELRCRAAGEQMRNGFVAEGLATIEPLAARAGLRLPGGVVGAVARIAYLRAWLRLRGLRPAPPAGQYDRRTRRMRLRQRICSELTTGMVAADPITTSAVGLRALLDALDLGDRAAVIHACGAEAIAAAAVGETRRFDALMRLFGDLLDRDRPPEVASLEAVHAIATLFDGRFAETHARCEAALRIPDAPPAVDTVDAVDAVDAVDTVDAVDGGSVSSQWMRDMLRVFSSLSLLYTLEGARMRAVYPAHMTATVHSGNLFAQVMVRVIGGTMRSATWPTRRRASSDTIWRSGPRSAGGRWAARSAGRAARTSVRAADTRWSAAVTSTSSSRRARSRCSGDASAGRAQASSCSGTATRCRRRP